jgi:hypothetical protein
VKVTLNESEMHVAAIVGARRQTQALDRGFKTYFEWGSGWERHIVAAMSELAVCKARDIHWTGLEGVGAPADVGRGGQVRSTTKEGNPLNVYPTDKDQDAFILVEASPPEFKIVGWIRGRDAKHDEFWQAFDNNIHGGAWRVPQSRLLPIDAEKAAA